MSTSPSRAAQSRPGSWTGLMTLLLHFSVARLLYFFLTSESFLKAGELDWHEVSVSSHWDGKTSSIPFGNQQDPGQTGQGQPVPVTEGALTFAQPLPAAALSTSPKCCPEPSLHLGVRSRRSPGKGHLPPTFSNPRPDFGLL